MRFEKEYFKKHEYLSRESQNRRFFLEVINWGSDVGNINFLNGKKKTALVVGCGCGFETDILSKLGYDVYGFDISKFAIKYANDRFKKPEFIICDTQNGLPFKSDFFDLVICFEVLEHLHYPLNALSEMFRVGNNAFLCTSPNRIVEKTIKTIFRDLDETHINSKTKKEWLNIIKQYLNPNFIKIESFMDSTLSINNKLLFFNSFKVPYFGLSLRR